MIPSYFLPFLIRCASLCIVVCIYPPSAHFSSRFPLLYYYCMPHKQTDSFLFVHIVVSALPLCTCPPSPSSMSALLVFILLVALSFWLHRVYLTARRFLQFWEIRNFYHHALGISTVSIYPVLSPARTHTHTHTLSMYLYPSMHGPHHFG